MSLLRHLDTLSADYYEDTPVGTVVYPFANRSTKSPISDRISCRSLRMFLTTGSRSRQCSRSVQLYSGDSTSCPCISDCSAALSAEAHFRSDLVQVDRASWSGIPGEHLSSVIPIQLLGQQKRQERKAFQRLGAVGAVTAKAVQKWAAAHSVQFLSRYSFHVRSDWLWRCERCFAGALSVGSLDGFLQLHHSAL